LRLKIVTKGNGKAFPWRVYTPQKGIILYTDEKLLFVWFWMDWGINTLTQNMKMIHKSLTLSGTLNLS